MLSNVESIRFLAAPRVQQRRHVEGVKGTGIDDGAAYIFHRLSDWSHVSPLDPPVSAAPVSQNDHRDRFRRVDGSARLNIGVFGIRNIPSTYSGYETFCTVLLPELARRGHLVTLYSRDSFGWREPFEGVRRYGLPSIASKHFDTLSHSVVASVRARLNRHDVVLAFNVANSPALSLLTHTGTPTVLNVDGLEWMRDKWGPTGKRVFRSCAVLSKRCATTLVTDCNAMSDVYLAEFGAESEVIPYCWTGLSAAQDPLSSDASLLDAFGLRRDEYVVVGGRLVPENQIAEIVEGYISSTSELPIAVLGTANYNSPVQHRLDALALDPRVRLLGHISDRHTFGVLLRDARVYIHGHSVGGINPSLLEAMGVGAFVVAYDTSFNREAAGEHGRYFDHAAKAWAAYELTKPQERHAQRALNKKRIAEHFSLAEVTDAYESVLKAAALKRIR